MISGGVEHDDIVGSLGWHQVDDGVRQIAVNVEDGESSPRLHIRMDEIRQQRRFAGSGCPDDIEVASPCFLVDADKPSIASKAHATERD